MKILIIILALAALAVVFWRRYLLTEKGASFRTLLRGKKSFHIFHKHEKITPEKFEVTAGEILPPKESVDGKCVAKAAILFKKAEILFGKGDLKAAEKTLIQNISLDPSSTEAYNKLGLIYLRQSQFRKAENIYRKLILTVSTDPAYFSNLGMALYSQGKAADAKGYYKKAIELDSGRAGRFFSLGQILHELGEVEDALAHLKKAIEMEPRNLDYLLSLANFYIDRNMPDDARHLLGEILALFPNNEMAQEMLAKVDRVEKTGGSV